VNENMWKHRIGWVRALLKAEFVAPALITVLFVAIPHAHAADVPLPRSTPEAQGISSQAILDFVEAADNNVNTMHSFMIVRHGYVIAQGWWKPEAADKPHVLKKENGMTSS
jgi:hypothetical protein